MSLYSERLLVAVATGGWTGMTVPTGMRAVVRNVLVDNGSGVAGIATLALNTAQIVTWVTPGTPVEISLETRVVAYAGEVLQAYLQFSPMIMTVSGYLFDDTIGRRTPPAGFSDELVGGELG